MATAKKASGAAKKGASATKKGAVKKSAAAKRAVPKKSPSAGKTIESYIAGLTGWKREAAAKLDALVREAAPMAKASIKWAQPVYESNGPMIWMKAFTGHVSLGFWRGTEFQSGNGVLEGVGDRMRHIKILAGDAVNEKLVRQLVREAVALNTAKGDPTKKRG